jgi:hypothetical protein
MDFYRIPTKGQTREFSTIRGRAFHGGTAAKIHFRHSTCKKRSGSSAYCQGEEPNVFFQTPNTTFGSLFSLMGDKIAHKNIFFKFF